MKTIVLGTENSSTTGSKRRDWIGLDSRDFIGPAPLSRLDSSPLHFGGGNSTATRNWKDRETAPTPENRQYIIPPSFFARSAFESLTQ